MKQHRPAVAVLGTGVLAALIVGLTACGSASADDARAAAEAPAATVTIETTVTATVTATPSASPSEPTSSPTPRSAEPAPKAAATSAPDGSPQADFDPSYARTVAGYIIEDIGDVDEYMQDGIAVPSALYMLSSSYDRMTDAGVPPGADPAKYMARLTTLSSFAESAGDEYDDSPVEATARYAVIRRETGVVFSVLNSAMGTHFKLPS